jgi:hypothetical protein
MAQTLDLNYRTLTKPIRDSHVNAIINSVETSKITPYDSELNWAERIGPIRTIRKKFAAWSATWVSGLDTFPYMYVMNGNTEYIHSIFSLAQTPFAWKRDDYRYYQHWHKAAGKPYIELDEPSEVNDLLVTWPGYYLGDRRELDFAEKCVVKRKHLDCAYLGVVKPMHLDVSDFETASFSFSKPFAIPYNRVALMFSKREIPSIDLLNKIGYVNLGGVNLASHIMDRLPINYWWDKYGVAMQQLCKDNNLTPTSSLLSAFDGRDRIGLAQYWQEYNKCRQQAASWS